MTAKHIALYKDPSLQTSHARQGKHETETINLKEN